MINRDLFDQESMWQCKADIMRLEILYKYGGVYIDADMVSLGKPLDHVVDSCKHTGFLMGYEPDTKDKPYSVLGNSFIVASKGHPLLRLLIGYIAAIYHHKRPYHTVEWVTGPLACTKALVHTDMPMTVPPTELFYPQVCSHLLCSSVESTCSSLQCLCLSDFDSVGD
jgi:mannosyltransferase OCH1-like enzyme